jgi:hypothetical protein
VTTFADLVDRLAPIEYEITCAAWQLLDAHRERDRAMQSAYRAIDAGGSLDFWLAVACFIGTICALDPAAEREGLLGDSTG